MNCCYCSCLISVIESEAGAIMKTRRKCRPSRNCVLPCFPHLIGSHHKHNVERSQTATTATTLASCRVRWSRCDIFDSPNLHARASQSTESRLCAWARGLSTISASGSDLDVKSGNAQFLASLSDILSCQHSCVRGGFVTVGFDFHAACHSADGFAATGITQSISL